MIIIKEMINEYINKKGRMISNDFSKQVAPCFFRDIITWGVGIMNSSIDMNEKKQAIEAYGNDHRESIIEKLTFLQGEYTKLIRQIELNIQVLHHAQPVVQNAAITVNNKLVEIERLFKKVGLSLYVQYHEDVDMISNSIVGDAILADIISKLMEANDKLKKYSELLFKIGNQFSNYYNGIYKNIFKRIFLLYNPLVNITIELTKEEHQQLDSFLQNYSKVENEIWNYHFEDHIVDSLVNSIVCTQELNNQKITYKYTAMDVPLLVAEFITPILTKLGLDKLIPQLQEKLIEKYRENTNLEGISQDEMYLYIPDFSRPIEYVEMPTILYQQEGTDNQQEEITYDEMSERQYRVELIEAIIAEMHRANLCPDNIEDIIREKLHHQKTEDLECMFFSLEDQNNKNISEDETRKRKKQK